MAVVQGYRWTPTGNVQYRFRPCDDFLVPDFRETTVRRRGVWESRVTGEEVTLEGEPYRVVDRNDPVTLYRVEFFPWCKLERTAGDHGEQRSVPVPGEFFPEMEAVQGGARARAIQMSRGGDKRFLWYDGMVQRFALDAVVDHDKGLFIERPAYDTRGHCFIMEGGEPKCERKWQLKSLPTQRGTVQELLDKDPETHDFFSLLYGRDDLGSYQIRSATVDINLRPKGLVVVIRKSPNRRYGPKHEIDLTERPENPESYVDLMAPLIANVDKCAGTGGRNSDRCGFGVMFGGME